MLTNHISKNSAAVFSVLLLLTASMSAFYTVTGVVLPWFLQTYDIGFSQIGLLPSLQSAGETAALFITGLFVWRVSPGKAVFTLFLGISCAFFVIGFKLLFPVTAALFFALGMLNGILNFFCTACIAQLFPVNRGRFITIYFMAQAIGCMVAPLYPSNALQQGLSWWGLYRQFAITALLLGLLYGAVWFICGKKGGGSQEKPANRGEEFSAFRFLLQKKDIKLYFLCLAVFTYMGHQVALGTWLPTYMENCLHIQSDMAGNAVSLFSAGMLAGRLLYTFLSKRIPAAKYGLIGTIAGGIVLSFGLWSGSGTVLIGAVALTGIFAGATSPLLISLGCDWFPEHTTAIASLTGLTGALGATVFSWLIGSVAQFASFEAAISITVVDLFLVALFIGLSVIWGRGGLKREKAKS